MQAPRQTMSVQALLRLTPCLAPEELGRVDRFHCRTDKLGIRYRHAARDCVPRSLLDLGTRGDAQLRRTCRPDRRHAPYPCRGEALDRRDPVLACTQLLHVASWAGSARTRHLYWLAAP